MSRKIACQTDECKKRQTYQNEYYKHKGVKRLEQTRNSHRKNRQQAIEAFGGKCVRCGFSDPRALQFDHIQGGGHLERKATSQASYSWYKKLSSNPEAYKNKYQLLCANCNFIKRHTNKEVTGPKPKMFN